MSRLCSAILATLIAFGVTVTTRAQGVDDHAIATDPTAVQVPISAPVASGWLKYRPVYPAGWERAIQVYLRFSRPEPLSCFNYSDFEYDLRDGEGRRLPTIDLSQSGEVFTLQSISPHDCAGDRALPRTEGRAYFKLDMLYGKLSPGEYKFTLTFAPRNHSIPAVALPMLEFQLTKR